MKYNLSFTEVVFRYVGLMFSGILFGITLNYFFIVLTVAFFITAIMGWCPIYQLMGIDHFGKTKEQEKKHRQIESSSNSERQAA